METGDDPYQILGVPITATAAEIKTAYRRLAIQHHPDKQRTAEEKERVTPLFVKISNAYELLSDPEERALHDQQQEQSAAASFTSNNNHHFSFHDPFQVFEQLFRSQMQGSMFPSMMGGNLFGMGMDTTMNMGMGMDTTMNMGMGMNGMNMNMGMNTRNMGESLMHGFGGLMSPPFGNFMSPMGMRTDPSTGGAAASVMTFSSSTSCHNVGRQSVSVSTTTRIVNGRRETRTERIVRHADGTMERIVETPDVLLPNQEPCPRIAQLPDTTEVSSDGSSTESAPDSKRKATSCSDKNTNGTTKPKKKRRASSPREGDPDRPIVLE